VPETQIAAARPASDPQRVGPLRILQVHAAHRDFGGEDVVVEEERSVLTSHGHVVEQFLVENPTGAVQAAGAVLRAPWNPTAARKVLATARAFRPDVVHVHNTWFALSPAVVAALARDDMPMVATLHNFRTVCANGLLLRQGKPCELCVGSHPGHAIAHRCYRDSALLSTSAALTIGVSRRLGIWQRHVARFFVLDHAAVRPLVAGGIPADRITVRPNFVGDGGPRSTPPSASNEVVYVGRLSPEKGPQLLVEAWRNAAPPGLRLNVFGDGPLRPELEGRRVAGVTFLGQVDRTQIAAALRQARVLVFPSTCRESGPLAPIEAAAAGLPIVVSDLVGMAQELAASGAGWSVAAGDAGSLAAAMSRLADAQEVDRAGAAARNFYEERYGAAAALHALEGVYRQVSYRHVTPR
jgi:glycosyltransferase involved in cell wall biosynthesis